MNLDKSSTWRGREIQIQQAPLGNFVVFERGSPITKASSTEGEIPVLAGGQKPAYFHDASNREGNNVVVAGSGAYAGFVSYWDTPIWVSDAFTVTPKDNSLTPKFLYHWLVANQRKIHSLKQGSGIPHVYGKDLAKLSFSLPPIEVQNQTVHILDTFAALETELEAELGARKLQFAHYRKQLIGFDIEVVESKKIDALVSVVRAKKIIPRSQYKSAGEFPIIDQGQGFIAGWTPDSSAVLSSGDYVVFGDHTRTLKYVDFPFAQGADGLQILRAVEGVNPRYLFHAMSCLDLPNRGYNRHWTIVRELEVPLPSLAHQSSIASKLDEFDTLVNDIKLGLPAELAARRKQFEYYRDQLLVFTEA